MPEDSTRPWILGHPLRFVVLLVATVAVFLVMLALFSQIVVYLYRVRHRLCQALERGCILVSGRERLERMDFGYGR